MFYFSKKYYKINLKKFRLIKIVGNFNLEKSSVILNYHFNEVLRGMLRRREIKSFVHTFFARQLPLEMIVNIGGYLNLYTFNLVSTGLT